MKWALNCDFTGHDIDLINSSSEECSSLCLANKNCTHFTWNDTICHVKSTNDKPPANPFGGTVCGWVFNRIDFNWQDENNGQLTLAHGCDFSGRDVGQRKSLRKECGGICLSNPECTHFSWGRDSNCFMKSAAVSDISPSSVTDGICGKINARIIVSSASNGEDIIFKLISNLKRNFNLIFCLSFISTI